MNYAYIYIYIYIYIARDIVCLCVHMAHFQLGSFVIGLVSNWAQFELHSFLMICRI